MERLTRIPKTLDNPGRIWGLPRDSLFLGIAVFSLFFVFDTTFLGLISGCLSGFFYSKYRKRTFLRKIARFLYWFLPTTFNPIKHGSRGYQRHFKMKREIHKKDSIER